MSFFFFKGDVILYDGRERLRHRWCQVHVMPNITLTIDPSLRLYFLQYTEFKLVKRMMNDAKPQYIPDMMLQQTLDMLTAEELLLLPTLLDETSYNFVLASSNTTTKG